MGTLKFKQTEQFKYSIYESAEITDWRTVAYDEKNNEIAATIFDCNEIIIRDLSLDEFHEINYCCQTVEKTFSLYSCHLCCVRCSGSGVSDWISETMRKRPNLQIIPFDRNPKGRVLAFTQRSGNTLYTSSPKLISSQKLCSYCHGSGLNRIHYHAIIDEFFIENC